LTVSANCVGKKEQRMSESEKQKELTGPWRSLHVAVWLIGLAVLASKGWWWPGILVLIAVSGVVEAFLSHYAPGGCRENDANSAPAPPAPPRPEHRLELLPAVCPRCGGPVRGSEVKWTGPQSADCAYCGLNLPMRED
jgi:hypothetical protein